MKKGLKILSIVFIVIGALLLIWYLCPIAAGILNEGNAVGIVGSGALILFGVFCAKIPSVPRNIIIALIAVFVLAVVAPVSFNMVRYADYKADEGAETVIVLGCKVRGETPSKFLYDRCLAAAEYLNDNPDAIVIASGGQGAGEDISEAQCIENILLENGINNLSDRVVIATNEFHEYRAKLYCDREGLEFHSHCSHTSFYSLLTFSTREMLGVVKYKFFG